MGKTTRSIEQFKFVHDISTRWHDNDIYGHINNVIYYSFFDTTVNEFLIASGLDIHEGEVIGFAVNSTCDYYKPLAFPDKVAVGMTIGKLGNSSVRYELAIFNKTTGDCCAEGNFTHVFVNRDSQLPTPIPDNLREALSTLIIG